MRWTNLGGGNYYCASPNGPALPEIGTPNHAAFRCINISFVFSVSQFTAEGEGVIYVVKVKDASDGELVVSTHA